MSGQPAPTFVKRGKRYLVNGDPIPSVTTILREGFPAPALVSWAARTTAAAAVDRWDELAGLSISERLRILERAAWESRDRAALRGTEIHALGERLVAGERVEIPDRFVGPVEAYARFLDAWDVQPKMTETPVCHPEHGWAGTFDLRATLRDGADWLLDLKTGKGVYESHVLQQAAYANAAWYLDPDGGGVFEWRRPERCGVIHITPDSAELVPIDADDRAYLTFRHAAAVARYAREASAAYKERRPWPVGRPLEVPSPVG